MTKRCSLAAAVIFSGSALVGSAVASPQGVSPLSEGRPPHLRAEEELIQARSRAEAASIAYEQARRERDRLIAEIGLLDRHAQDAAAALDRASRAEESAAQTVGARRGLLATALLSELRMRRGALQPAEAALPRLGIASWIARAERDAAVVASGQNLALAHARLEAETVARSLEISRSRLATVEASLEEQRKQLIEEGIRLHEAAARHDAMVRLLRRRGHLDEHPEAAALAVAGTDGGRTGERPSLRFPVEATVLQRFGERRGEQRSRGVVLRVERPQAVVAPGRGRVAFADSFRGLGPLLIIDHGHDYHSLVIGASRLEVREGDIVDEGRVVGWLDGIGPDYSELYLELRKLGEPIDPLMVVTVREGEVRG